MKNIGRNIENQLDGLRITVLGEYNLLLWAQLILQMVMYVFAVAFASIAFGVLEWMGAADSLPVPIEVWYRFSAS